MAQQTHPSTIELNGQRYNTRTGMLIDGVRRAPVASQPHTALAPKFPQKQSSSERASTPSKQVHTKLQPSKTLMRHAVKKPSTITTRTTVAMDVVQHNPSKTITQVFHNPVPGRAARASSIPKLSVIKRFGDIAPAPRNKPVNTDTQSNTKTHQTITAVPQMPFITPAAHASTPTNPAQRSSADSLIENGLRAANSHTAPSAKKAKLHHRAGKKLGLSSRATSFIAGSMAVLLLGGFFMFQNIPNLSVRYAAAKSGVHGGLPGYQPAGFAVNNRVQYSPGKISISYKANADDRSYVITQENTSWDSEALRDHLASSSNSLPQTYPNKGQTIYLHDNAQADWVQGGVWYSISGNSSLNTDQIIKIATSI